MESLRPSLALLAVFTLAPLTAGAQEPLATELKQIRELRRDISTLNLLNALRLSSDQAREVLGLAEEAKRTRQGSWAEQQEALAAIEEAEQAFAALKTEIEKGEPARGPVEQRAKRAKKRIKDLEQAHKNRNGLRQETIESRLTRVLTPGQLQVVEAYKPCLIPPAGLRDPVRAGQAVGSRHAERLRRLRQVPERAWDHRRGRFVARMVERIRRHLPMTDDEAASERERIATLLNRVRSLSDVEFELSKNDLARQLKPRERVVELRDELDRRVRGRRRSKLERFLLDERIIPILKARLDDKMARRGP